MNALAVGTYSGCRLDWMNKEGGAKAQSFFFSLCAVVPLCLLYL
jgi:hypothetical protein